MIQASLISKLQSLTKRHQEVGELLSSSEVVNNQNEYRKLSKEYATLDEIVTIFTSYTANHEQLNKTAVLLEETVDEELRKLAKEELLELTSREEEFEQQLRILLLPKDLNDDRNVFLEIRAGAGGDEAAIFVGDLLRMYTKYIESLGWHFELVSLRHSEYGGYKEVIARVTGSGVYAQLKFESGVHRVQRVPETEAQGRIHTSTCTVAIIVEAEEIDQIEINPVDLKIDTYRSSGAGGQHVNVTDSAIRITHLPSGVVVECQDERSQHKNRAKAMSLLRAKLLAAEREKQQQEESANRRSLVGTGDRSERIRTYNFPQGRLTDHRINLTLYQLEKIMLGELNLVIEPLIQEYHASQLAKLTEKT